MRSRKTLVLGLPRVFVIVYVVLLLGTAGTAAVFWYLALSPPPSAPPIAPTRTHMPSATPRPRVTFELASTPSVAIGPDNSSQVQLLAVWDAAPCAARWLCPEIPTSLDVSPDGQSVVTGSSDGVVRIRRLADGDLVRAWSVNVPLTDVAFSPYGRSVATAASNGLGLWRAADGSFVDRIELPATGSRWVGPSLAFVPDGLEIQLDLVLNCQPAWWRLDPYSAVGVWISKHCGGRRIAFAFAPLAISRDGRTLAAGVSWRNMPTGIKVWRVPDRLGLSGFPPDRVRAIAVSPDGQLVAFGCTDGAVRLWGTDDCLTPRTGIQCLRSPAVLGGHPEGAGMNYSEGDDVSALAFSGDGRLLVAASLDGLVRVWGVR